MLIGLEILNLSALLNLNAFAKWLNINDTGGLERSKLDAHPNAHLGLSV